MIDIVTAIVWLAGSAFALLAAVGVLRMPDVFTRMQASTKASTLGLGCLLLGAALQMGDFASFIRVGEYRRVRVADDAGRGSRDRQGFVLRGAFRCGRAPCSMSGNATRKGDRLHGNQHRATGDLRSSAGPSWRMSPVTRRVGPLQTRRVRGG